MPKSFEANFIDRAGVLHEDDLFGQVKKNDPAYAEEYRKLKPDSKGYIPYDKALKLAKDFQPGDPTNPQRGFLRDLRVSIIDALGMEQAADMDRVKVYTAVGSPLDRWHGTDAFVEVEGTGKDRSVCRVSLDASLDKKKLAGLERPSKSDILVGEVPDKEEDRAHYFRSVEEIGKQVAEEIKAKMSHIRRAA